MVLLESIMSGLLTADVVAVTTFRVGSDGQCVYLQKIAVTVRLDIVLHVLPGAKGRTFKEFETLAFQAGFAAFKSICRAYNYWAMELFQNVNNSPQ
ncbi:caffeic acid 3-O-methyltransferase-like isoform X2 [Gossypium australe]|uniref:Caffeic acid 3-O-methyltransferase-like isoform X2 n=1 Tax=Gossypium australe TaxID=47621 RepID=A0A5B6WX26_9ROSI|nr:caffeic acid 3-O-methyltransferase-like isoform X2 [Gossypium australe]